MNEPTKQQRYEAEAAELEHQIAALQQEKAERDAVYQQWLAGWQQRMTTKVTRNVQVAGALEALSE